MNVWHARRIEGECVGWTCTAPDGVEWVISKPHPEEPDGGYWLSFVSGYAGASRLRIMIGLAHSRDIAAVFHAYRLLAL